MLDVEIMLLPCGRNIQNEWHTAFWCGLVAYSTAFLFDFFHVTSWLRLTYSTWPHSDDFFRFDTSNGRQLKCCFSLPVDSKLFYCNRQWSKLSISAGLGAYFHCRLSFDFKRIIIIKKREKWRCCRLSLLILKCSILVTTNQTCCQTLFVFFISVLEFHRQTLMNAWCWSMVVMVITAYVVVLTFKGWLAPNQWSTRAQRPSDLILSTWYQLIHVMWRSMYQ